MPRVTIAAASSLAAEAGAVIAEEGGNAVDAAIAATIVAMCTEPGIIAPAAGGFITIDAGGDSVVIDGYAEMPGRAADPDRLGSGDRVHMAYGGGMETIIGYGSVATPGIWAGLEEAWRTAGVAAWQVLFEPAIKAVDQGFPLSVPAARYLAYSHDVVFGWDPASRTALHQPDGSCLEAGDTVRIPDLGDTLRLLADEGADALYRGDLGAVIAEAVDRHGGILTRTDLESYQVVVRTPLRFELGGAIINTNPEPAVGGATMAAIALLAVHAGFTGWDDAGIAALARVQRMVLDYRHRHLGNAPTIPHGIERLMKAARLGDVGAILGSPSTVHTSAADTDGAVCSITVSAGYGAGAVPPGTGFWLNNSLGELELHPAGYHGLSPGTRLISNMAPTTARREDTALAIGSPGADRITTALSTVLLGFLVGGMSLTDAVAQPRLHTEIFAGRPTIACEPGLLIDATEDVVLRRFPDLSMYFGGVAAAMSSAEAGLFACADPRRHGATADGG